MKTNLTDHQLMIQFLNGDNQAFSIVVTKYNKFIYGRILSLTKNTHLAKDLTQDVWLKVSEAIQSGRYEEKGSFGGWLNSIGHNLFIDYTRRSSRMPFLDLGKYSSVFDIITHDLEGNIEDKLICTEIHSAIKVVVEKIPTSQRTVLKLRYFEGRSFKEIAEITNVSINTALGRMRYALINIRRLIKKHGIMNNQVSEALRRTA